MLTSTVSVPEVKTFGVVSGTHVIADLYGCPRSAIMTDAGLLERTCVEYVRDAGLLDVGILFHAFPGEGGVTGTVILAESHLCLHTWPEHGYVSLDVYVCNYTSDNSEKARGVANRLIELFAAQEARVREVTR